MNYKLIQINENQELLDDWLHHKKKCFCFYGKKFNIVLREDSSDGDIHKIVCAKGNEVCVAGQFKTIWFIAYGQKKKMNMVKGGDKGKKKEPGFAGAQQAYASITKDIWDALEEAGV